MASRGRGARTKGASFQRQVRSYLAELGFEPQQRGTGDEGDDVRLARIPSLSIELKCWSADARPMWWRQAVEQAEGRIPVLIHKRVGKGAAPEQWVTMDLGQFTRLLRLLREVDHRQWESLAGSVDHGRSGEFPSGEVEEA